MAESGWSATAEVDDGYQHHGHSDDRSQSDHPQPVVVMIFKPDKQPQYHVGKKEDDGNGLEHRLKWANESLSLNISTFRKIRTLSCRFRSSL